ncbi:VWA domain-containing protein [Bacillus atrophaeus]|uniref:VWA domain-containing protein n=1 Tax=Bacillus atrophaeus TaxID=1452 RepID=UPI0022814556|nr:VWA domain-containing protein [Bacillus atrophaeus]MCY9196000.1 VWA domain-containing protein [Bacillus atrophaeus]
MDKLEEVKKFDITIITSWLKKYAECGEGIEKAWFFLIEQAELAEKRLEIIEENKRQQEVAVHQFRQTQKDIQHLSGEMKRYKQTLEKIITNLNFAITVAQNELEGEAE